MTKRTFYDLVGEELFPNGVYPQPEIDELDKRLTELADSIKNTKKFIELMSRLIPPMLVQIKCIIDYMTMQSFLRRGVGVCQIRPYVYDALESYLEDLDG